MSLSRRLLLTTSVVLLATFTVTIFLLDYLFRQTGENAIRELLEVQAYSLLGLVDTSPTGDLVMPDDLPESRLSGLGSDDDRFAGRDAAAPLGRLFRV